MTDHFIVINRAIDFIENSLEENIKADQVAKVASYSPYYFYRIFKGMTGYTVKDYLRRRRLTHAAYEIAITSDSILNIALKYGFESQAAFTRSFKEIYSKAPGQFRQQPLPGNFLSKIDLEKRELNIKKIGGISMVPKVIHIPDMTVIGLSAKQLKVIGIPDREENQNVIPALWDTFNTQYNSIPGKLNTRRTFGICLPDQTGLHFTYMCATEVEDTTLPPEGMEKMRIEGGSYAVFTYEGTADGIAPFTETLYENYFPQSGLTFRHGPEIECYGSDFNPVDPASKMEIWIPVEA